MAVEIAISHVIEKMKYLQERNRIMNLPILTARVNGSKEILEEFLEYLKKLNDSGRNSSEINGWNGEDVKELLYSSEDEIDSFLVKTALAKASPVAQMKYLSNQFFLSNKMGKIFCRLKEIKEEMQENRRSNSKDMGDGLADPSGNNLEGKDLVVGASDPKVSENMTNDLSNGKISEKKDSSGNSMVDLQPEIKNTSGVEQLDQQLRVLLSSNNFKGKDLIVGASDSKVNRETSETANVTDTPRPEAGEPSQRWKSSITNGASDLKVNREISETAIVTDAPRPESREPSQRWKSSITKVTAVNRLQISMYNHANDEEKIVGMKDKLQELAQLTLNRYATYFPISVVGRAGSGKTFLVRQIFNQSQTRRNFDKFAFVSISQNFKERDVLAEILQQVAGVKDHSESSSGELKKKLGFFLARKRYLIVLDDVHHADVWNKLKLAFQNPLKSSRVILTIRDVNVARRIAPTVVLLHLRPLAEDESWQLFSKRLKDEDRLSCPDKLKKQIWENCEGLPLQILVLGGLLASKSLTEWSKVLEQIEKRKEEKKRVDTTEQKRRVRSQHTEQDKPKIKVTGRRTEQVKLTKQEKKREARDERQSSSSKRGDAAAARDEYQPSSSEGAAGSIIFDMGFQELDSTLKECFYYLCLFPKSSKIRTRKLFRLWVAEGLVTSAEDVMGNCLVQLESRNMIEIADLTSDGMAKTCQVPTALYDKFISNAVQELGYHHVAGTPSISSEINIRKLSVFSDIQVTLDSCKYVRSYICFDKQKGDKPAQEVGNLIEKIRGERGFGFITLLDLEDVYKPQLPKNLGKVLPLLKFVGLRGTLLDSIPDSIGDLPFLETLDVKRTNITRLPISVWNAQELQHLYMNENSFENSNPESSSICYPSCYPSSSCYPSKLQTLCGLLIGNNNPPIDWLKKLTDLRKLGLTCHSQSLGDIIGWIDGVSELQTLKLRAINEFIEPSDITGLGSMNGLQKLTNLNLLGKLPGKINTSQLPPNIIRLTLSVSQLSDDPMEQLGRLRELKVLKLLARSYIGENMTCCSGGFGKLQVLNLWMLTELKQWTIQPEAMLELTRLEIRHCRKLSKPDGLENLASLKRVRLTNMKEDFVDQVKGCLRQDISIENPNYSFDPSWD